MVASGPLWASDKPFLVREGEKQRTPARRGLPVPPPPPPLFPHLVDGGRGQVLTAGVWAQSTGCVWLRAEGGLSRTRAVS